MDLATNDHYKEFLEDIVWQDLMIFFNECLEVNRDLLEGIKQFGETAKIESDDALRGRNWQIRDIIAYVNERASYAS